MPTRRRYPAKLQSLIYRVAVWPRPVEECSLCFSASTNRGKVPRPGSPTLVPPPGFTEARQVAVTLAKPLILSFSLAARCLDLPRTLRGDSPRESLAGSSEILRSPAGMPRALLRSYPSWRGAG
jgi:hypothetical protein